MPRFHAQVTETLTVAPDRVMEILRDYRVGHPAILPRPPFTDLEIVDGPGVGAGTTLEVGMRAMGRTRRLRGVVSEPEPGKRLVERYEGPDRIVTTFTVLWDNSGSRVTIETEGETQAGGILGAIEGWLTAGMLKSVFRREMKLLDDRSKLA